MDCPLVSIVVPTLGRQVLLDRFLESVDATVDVPHEVILVTVACGAGVQVQARRPHHKVLEQPNRDGFVRAANFGMHAATGEYVTVLNDDCVLLPHTIANAVRFLEAPAHAGVGQAAFFHDTPVRRNVHAQVDIEDVRYVVCHVRGLCYANFGLARRDLFERLDFFDERYFMYGADPDFSLKVWYEAGLSVEPCPGALIHHAQANDERARTDRDRQSEDNRMLFEKWGLGGEARRHEGTEARSGSATLLE